MAADIFRHRLDRQIRATRQRRIVQRRRPGIVEQHGRAACVRNLGTRRHVLHLEGQRAGALAEHRLGVRLEQFGDAGADQRVVIGRLDPESPQHLVAENPCRGVAGVGHQEVIAGAARRQDRHRHGVQAGAEEHGPGGTLQRIHGVLEAAYGGIAAAAVGEGHVVRVQRGDVGIEDGRGPVDGRVHDADMRGALAPGAGQRRFAIFLAVRHGALPNS